MNHVVVLRDPDVALMFLDEGFEPRKIEALRLFLLDEFPQMHNRILFFGGSDWEVHEGPETILLARRLQKAMEDHA